ncbi:MAG: hypothetical protein OEL53_08270 [Rhodospirillales bacterium]|nr:hypothetical protein [Rhodospirillales bacterium]
MPKQQHLLFLAVRLAQAQARNIADLREAQTLEEKRIAEGQRLVLNAMSGWLFAAFQDAT